MKHCSFFCAGIWPFLILPLLLLALLLFFMQRSIEHTVAANAELALAANHAWAKPETHERGRDILLTGTAPNKAAVTKATALALQAEGVRAVVFVGDISPTIKPKTIPAKLALAFSNSQLILSGRVKDHTTVDEIVAAANLHYGAEQVVNHLRTGSTDGAIGWAKLVDALEGLNDGAKVSISNHKITLSGQVNSLSVRETIETDLRLAFSGELENDFIVRPTIVQPTIQIEPCLKQLTALLSKSKISFDSGKAQIRESSNTLLQGIADITKRCPDTIFEVAGHTDSIGDVEMNMSLSQFRAEAVVNRLTSLGLKPEQFTAQGYGPTRAIGDNSTPSGRATNRRIEFKIKK